LSIYVIKLKNYVQFCATTWPLFDTLHALQDMR